MFNPICRFNPSYEEQPFIARVTTNPNYPHSLRDRHVFFAKKWCQTDLGGFTAIIRNDDEPAIYMGKVRELVLGPASTQLADGDVLHIRPRQGELRILYARQARSNNLFLTSRCNNNCIMCSQPPRTKPDGHLAEEALDTIPLIDRSAPEIGITGGEPTLLGKTLIKTVARIRSYLPDTSIHLLTNGRLLKYISFAMDLAEAGGPNLAVGVPVNSDLPETHNYICQVDGAFDETMLGLLNLQRCGVSVELRIVLQKSNVTRLAELAVFIRRNLTFASHVAFMAVEVTGLAKRNRDVLWVDPSDYSEALQSAVRILDRAGMNVSLYNIQHCVVSEELWSFCRQSISDWKNAFPSECDGCSQRHKCCGFFTTDGMVRGKKFGPL